jgi:hypothetical protein
MAHLIAPQGLVAPDTILKELPVTRFLMWSLLRCYFFFFFFLSKFSLALYFTISLTNSSGIGLSFGNWIVVFDTS